MTYVLFGLIAAAIGFGISLNPIIAAANFLLIALISYATLPTLAIDFADLYVIILVSLPLPILAGWQHPPKGNQRLLIRNAIGAGAAFALALFIMFLTTSPWFHADAYHKLIGPIEETEFSTAVETLDQKQIRIADEGLARRRGEELLGNAPRIGSRVKIGAFSVQNVAGRLRWVAPLEPKGFLTWRGNDGTPGYVMVDAHNTQDASLVLNDAGGNPIRLLYTQDAFFWDDLHRLVYTSGYASTGLTDFTFEVDDDGRPFWVVTTYSKRIGMSGSEADGVIVVDPQTGAMTRHGITDAPAWIDRIQPAGFIDDQLDDHGEYVHGPFNWSRQDQFATTEGIELVYDKNGRASWYTGIRAMGNTEGTIGFALVDSRTKQARMFRQAGATETAAKNNMQGKIANYKDWAVTSPILYNIAGKPTYIASVTDAHGNFKGVAIANVAWRDIVVYAESLREALRMYEAALSNANMGVAPSPVVRKPLAGTTNRIGFEIIDGRTFYSLVLAERTDLLIIIPAGISPKTPVTRPGDIVTLEIEEGADGVVRAVAFDIPAIGTRMSAQ